jgi:hypothetical protein
MIRGPAEKSETPLASGVTRKQLTDAQSYRTRSITAQIIPLPGLRPCALCGVFVGNTNLGGYNGRSALTGSLFCLKCADGGTPL